MIPSYILFIIYYCMCSDYYLGEWYLNSCRHLNHSLQLQVEDKDSEDSGTSISRPSKRAA